MDFATPVILNGVGVLGLLGAQFWMLSTGLLVTRREANAYIERAKAAEAERASLIAQNTELMEMARLGRTFFNALNDRVNET